MPALTVTSFAAFANLTVAACKLATGDAPVDRLKALADVASGAKSLDAAFRATGLAAVSAEMARVAENHARHFTHAGRARDDAVALFWQVAPAAFADPDVFAAAHLDPDLTADRMVAAIRTSPLARDFFAAPLPEQFFRAVAVATLEVMLNRAETVEALAPALWRESLKTTGAIKDDTAEIRATTTRLEKVLQSQSQANLEEMQRREAENTLDAVSSLLSAMKSNGITPRQICDLIRDMSYHDLRLEDVVRLVRGTNNASSK